MNEMVFLWGFMGAGKSKLGKRLAKKCQIQFVDLDEFIEQQEQQTITELFSSIGETQFRHLETNYLTQLIQENQMVLLSCGGGTPCFNQNKSLMNNAGITIYLEVDKNILTDRLWQGKAKRPLIAKMKNKTDLAEYIQTSLNQREPYYKTAHFSFNNTYPKGNISELVEIIEKSLGN